MDEKLPPENKRIPVRLTIILALAVTLALALFSTSTAPGKHLMSQIFGEAVNADTSPNGFNSSPAVQSGAASRNTSADK